MLVWSQADLAKLLVLPELMQLMVELIVIGTSPARFLCPGGPLSYFFGEERLINPQSVRFLEACRRDYLPDLSRSLALHLVDRWKRGCLSLLR